MESQSTKIFDAKPSELKELVKNIHNIAKELEVHNVELLFDRQLRLTHFGDNKSITIFVEGHVSVDRASVLDSFKQKIETLTSSFSDLNLRFILHAKSEIGDKLPKIENIKNVFDNKLASFSHQKGQIVVLQAWTYNSQISLLALIKNSKFIEQNSEKWGKYVKFVTVNMDQNLEKVKDVLKAITLEGAEHYFAEDHTKQFVLGKSQGVWITTQDGLIAYHDPVNLVQLDDQINILIKNELKIEEKKFKEFSMIESEFTLEKELLITKQYEKNHNENKKLLETSNYVITFSFQRAYQRQEVIDPFVDYRGSCKKDQVELIKAYYDGVIRKLPKPIKYQAMVAIKPGVDIPYGGSCSKCFKDLDKSIPHYISSKYFIKKDLVAYCQECGDKEMSEEIKNPRKLFHPCVLIYLTEKNSEYMKDLERIIVKTELISEKEPDFEYKTQTKELDLPCHFCEQPRKNYGWNCANCYSEYCHECFKILNDPNHQRFSELEQKVKSSGHDLNHVLYRNHYLMRPEEMNLEFIEF